MVRTKLVLKRVRIRQWPLREPYTQFKIKTLLPEQKIYRSLGKNILKMVGLAPNWEDDDAATCSIINYFVDRQNTEIIKKKNKKT